jgi:cytochrome c5
MSDAKPSSAQTPSGFNLKRWIFFLGIVVPVIVSIVLVTWVLQKPFAPAPDLAAQELAAAQRIQRIGTVALREATRELRTGQQVYQSACMACHAAGVVGAPIFGDIAAWAPRIGAGLDRLVTSTLQGKGAMGAQGGGAFSDFEIKLAVVYLANASGGNFPQPTPPEGAAPAAAQ